MAESLLIVRVGDQFFGVDVALTRSVLPSVAVTPVPGSPPFVKGVSNIDGTIIAVIDVATRLSIESDDSCKRACLVETSKGPAVLLVDDALEVVAIDQIQAVMAEESPFIIGTGSATLTHLRDEPLEAVVLLINPDGVCGVAA